MKVKYIIVHTAAHGNVAKNIVYDTSSKQIDLWHKGNGWKKIGYHYVIRLNGTIELGRSELEIGAHVAGLNNISLGICCSGHGDIQDFTEEQKDTLVNLIASLCKKYELPYTRVFGHREVNNLVYAGVLGNAYLVKKSCPGIKVDMKSIRLRIKDLLSD